MRGRDWTTAELRHLELNKHKPDKEIAPEINRTVFAVQQMRRRYGMAKGKKKEWTKQDVDFLIENRHRKNRELSIQMGRTERAVRGARYRYCVPKKAA